MSQQLNSGRQQRAITPTVTTASFKPLSLDEIMLVPLAKQKAEDQMIMDMDELDLMATNSLGADNAYVNAQRDAFKGEVGSVRDRLMTEGVDRSLINKFKGLRSRKNLEFSVNGNTGKANAAYNAMQLNKKNIMNNNKLSSEQKRLGILEAESAYDSSGGVGAGAEYIDYIGNDYIDTNDEAQKIAAQMTPQSIGESTGYTFDGKTYKDASGKTVTLTPEQIQRVAYDTMKSNTQTMAYLKEAQRLGIIVSADDELRRAAINAGNMYQRKDSTTATNSQVGNMGKDTGGDDAVQSWEMQNTTGVKRGLYIGDLEVLEEDVDGLFTDGIIADRPEDWDEDDQEREDWVQSLYDEQFSPEKKKVHTDSYGSVQDFLGIDAEEQWEARIADFNRTYRGIGTGHDKMKKRKGIKDKIAEMKEKYPSLNKQKLAVLNDDGTVAEPARPWNEEEIFKAILNGSNNASVAMGQISIPYNSKSTFYNYVQDNVIGTEDRAGSFASSQMQFEGFPAGGVDLIAEQMEFSDTKSFIESFQKTGKAVGLLPGNLDFPGAYGIQMKDSDGNIRMINVENGSSSGYVFNTVSRMNKALSGGIAHQQNQFTNDNGDVVHKHIMTDINPSNGSMSAYSITTQNKDVTKEDIENYMFKKGPRGYEFAYTADGTTQIFPTVMRSTYDQEMQRANIQVERKFNEIKTGNTN